jgi:hypothetical protein
MKRKIAHTIHDILETIERVEGKIAVHQRVPSDALHGGYANE